MLTNTSANLCLGGVRETCVSDVELERARRPLCRKNAKFVVNNMMFVVVGERSNFDLPVTLN